MTDDRLPADAGIGRAALRVFDSERQREFYESVLGLESRERTDGRTELTAGGGPLLVLVDAPDVPDRPREAAGLFHVAVRVPDREALADALARVRDRWQLTGASDHLVSEALYLSDPEGNGLEIYRDRPESEWPRTEDGRVDMRTLPLDLEDLSGGDASSSLPPGTDVGHVHLEVTDLDRARECYVDALGFDVSAAYEGSALFLAAGGYHHHVGLNTWNHRTEAAGDHRGLAWFEVTVPDEEALSAVRDRLRARDVGVQERNGALEVDDPDGIAIRVTVA